MDTEQQKALDMIRAVHEDGSAEINGRAYEFTTMTHKQRRKVFAFYTQVAEQVQAQNFGFLDDPKFEAVERVINDAVTVDGSLLSRKGDQHWDEHPEDYLLFIGTALAVISYPFLSASPTA